MRRKVRLTKTVEVVFPDHIHTAEASSTLWQWDYGQRLIITGAALPESYEVHFCNAGDVGTKKQIGDVTGVDIPDEYLTTGKNILAFIYLHTDENDGETVYKITIKVKPRPRPTEMFLTEVQHDALDQAISQLEKYADATREVDSTPVQNSMNLVTSGGVYTALAEKQGALTFDNEPLLGSSNPITSGAVAAALENVQGKLTMDDTPTEGSGNPVKSNGIYLAIYAVANIINRLSSEVNVLKRRVSALEANGASESISFEEGVLDLNGDTSSFSEGTLDINSRNVTYNDGVVDVYTGDVVVSSSADGTYYVSGADVHMDNGTLDINGGTFSDGVFDI